MYKDIITEMVIYIRGYFDKKGVDIHVYCDKRGIDKHGSCDRERVRYARVL